MEFDTWWEPPRWPHLYGRVTWLASKMYIPRVWHSRSCSYTPLSRKSLQFYVFAVSNSNSIPGIWEHVSEPTQFRLEMWRPEHWRRILWALKNWFGNLASTKSPALYCGMQFQSKVRQSPCYRDIMNSNTANGADWKLRWSLFWYQRKYIFQSSLHGRSSIFTSWKHSPLGNRWLRL